MTPYIIIGLVILFVLLHFKITTQRYPKQPKIVKRKLPKAK